ncbi:MAG: hypothetical protein A3B99_00050 [Candidatus Yanofskybacteria bacterium RIFCSPHIGHO2_02_FULL_44_12b]|uniref:Transglycosylase SLT domain-containing protein n=2 Tax=Candidatus Yanofskyibacteriota TaxID=1752733 RepID=A0A1F8GLJ6_9BACT|nr:MAG: hypothetical protein UW79_C0013G0026 [Candidatus Yanofskybacteria bacterium GW2011_GWA2_44_9]OGN04145.1 MAG: hypothetical protein A2659_01495 [Candidatus Yanofskybacteria bacterium RIFCSPHIGHO2_01_FULL_44_24]OGN14739.1 MAG: hypothetical protein A3B99_00050 [Candidatus Yanofskybacteria bacterium RIFCSPHIGHO2_02_FULL_44_12b]OGN25870.1 MAG: hypothetical protein A2925_02410 [Candidatus Yanofskybacteria bacterium RIFCSPLOWO2_01_FULL_44_22]
MTALKHKKTAPFIAAIVLWVFFVFFCTASAATSTQEEIAEKQRQIEEIQKQIEAYQLQVDTTRSKSRTLENEIGGLNAKISQLTLEIRGLELSINKTSLEINDTEAKIGDASTKIGKHKNALAQFIKILHEADQKTLTEVLLNNPTLSNFFNNLNSIQVTQNNLGNTIQNIKTLKISLEEYQADLEDKKSDLERLKRVEDIEKSNLNKNKSDKNKLLKDTKGQESKFQELIKKSQKDIEAIRSQVTYLQQYGVTAEDAVKYGQLAAIATSIRPAFLIAILEIESGLGRNVGTGNWLNDMYECYRRLGKLSRAEAEKKAFFQIVEQLGLDPNSVKVSREPNYGCGGALGPAQFLPSTWLGYAERVARLTGNNPPNPWNIEDAFMAAAIKLADGGATSKDKTGETRAAKAYISGRPTCTSSICNYYSNAVLRKASEIEKNL